jgi:hypothetical protein
MKVDIVFREIKISPEKDSQISTDHQAEKNDKLKEPATSSKQGLIDDSTPTYREPAQQSLANPKKPRVPISKSESKSSSLEIMEWLSILPIALPMAIFLGVFFASVIIFAIAAFLPVFLTILMEDSERFQKPFYVNLFCVCCVVWLCLWILPLSS